jgi:hypothetical protein
MSDREREADRHGSIDRIAPALENRNPNIGRMWFDRDHHRMARQDWLSGL